MKLKILLQARTNSSRLPAKSLLPIAGVPLAVLAFKRATNLNATGLVVTSNEPEDDELCSLFEKNNINFYRGSQNNVLERFYEATKHDDPETPFVRLTADNVFPDEDLINQVAKHFYTSNIEYLICNGYQSNLPYGVSLEISKIKFLREAYQNSSNSKQLEHVTTYIKERYGSHQFIHTPQSSYLSNKSCTIDTFEDYLKIASIFRNIEDPINISYLALVKLLDKAPDFGS